jgi:hypothetical protein
MPHIFAPIEKAAIKDLKLMLKEEAGGAGTLFSSPVLTCVRFHLLSSLSMT